MTDHSEPAPDPMDRSDEVRRKILTGDKIGAIKLYRELTGVGLAEAKSAVEQMQTRLRGFESAELSFPKRSSETAAPQSSAAINEAVLAGRKIEAIKLYRTQTQASLAEAKAAVEEIEEKLRISAPGLFAKPPARNGCAMSLVIVVLLTLALWRVLS